MKSSVKGTTILAVAALAATAVAGGALAAIAAHPTSRAAVSKIIVTETDYQIALDNNTVPPGKVNFVVTNSGSVAHKFALKGKVAVGVKKAIKGLIQPGQTKSITIPLKKGTYQLVCALHVGSGMTTTLTVARPTTTTPTPTTTVPDETTTTVAWG